MIEDQEEILKSGEDYRKKREDLTNSLAQVKNITDQASEPERKADLAARLRRLSSSSLFGLYDNLAKNARSVVKLGTEAFPKLTMTRNAQNRTVQISNSPNFSSALNEHLQALINIAQTHDKQILPGGGTITPCFSTRASGETITNFLKKKKPQQTMEDTDIPDFGDPDVKINHCDGKECSDCTDCSSHQHELANAIKGIFNGTDGMRQLHMKNLITVLGSWAAHQDSKGGNVATQDDPKFNKCRLDHDIFGTTLRVIGNKLRKSYEKDYKDSFKLGGGRHRDFFPGVGNDTRQY